MFSSDTLAFFEQEIDDCGGQDINDDLALAVLPNSRCTLSFVHGVSLCGTSKAERSILEIAMRMRAAEPRRMPSPPAARS
jgi:hypothetical protein